jgi:hypothetical protein
MVTGGIIIGPPTEIIGWGKVGIGAPKIGLQMRIGSLIACSLSVVIRPL